LKTKSFCGYILFLYRYVYELVQHLDCL